MRNRWVGLAAVVLLVAGCSSNDSGGAASTDVPASSSASVVGSGTASGASGTAPAADEPPRVDLIAPAVAALEAQLGGPQDYFEINATSKLVNLIIALNGGTLAQTWLYLDGQLTSRPAEPAQGHTFAASALNFDPSTILAQVRRDLPNSSIDLFFVQGAADGSVRSTAVVTSSEGGQLQVILDPTGKVLEVDPN